MQGRKLTGVIAMAAVLTTGAVAEARPHPIKNPRIQAAIDSFMRHNRKHFTETRGEDNAQPRGRGAERAGSAGPAAQSEAPPAPNTLLGADAHTPRR